MFYLSANYLCRKKKPLFINRFVRVNTDTQTVLNQKVSDTDIVNVIPSSKKIKSF